MTIEDKSKAMFPGQNPLRKRTVYADGARWMLDKATAWLEANAVKYGLSNGIRAEFLTDFKKAMEE